jgi:hypothetical protein
MCIDDDTASYGADEKDDIDFWRAALYSDVNWTYAFVVPSPPLFPSFLGSEMG